MNSPVLDINGKELWHEKRKVNSEQIAFTVSELQKGMYFLLIKDENGAILQTP